MVRSPKTTAVALFVSVGVMAALSIPLMGPAQAVPTPVVDRALATSPELSETRRLKDRRTVITGDRAWALGTADGYYPAAGFHTRGEMGGFWLPNVKLLDGMWFGINGELDRTGHEERPPAGGTCGPTCPPPTGSRPAAPNSCPTASLVLWWG